ncbi:MAG: ATP-binding protein [Ekhidna sp.]
MQFSQIPGLTELKTQLITAFNRGKVAHAQLFSGGEGTSALPMAMAYATFLMCENKTENDSCGTCANCVRIQKLVHPDIHLHFPKISANESKYAKVMGEAIPLFREFVMETPFGTLEDWTRKYGQENKNILISREDSRQMLKNVSMRSVEGGFKILIIWLPEMMNPSSANAILKILEEPPENTIYLLVSYSYERLLATITSRTQLVTVPPNTNEEIQLFLEAQGVESEKAAQTSLLSEGKVGLAMHFSKAEESQEYQEFQQWMRECWGRDFATLVKRSEDFSKSGKAAQKNRLTYSISLLRKAIIGLSGNNAGSTNEEEEKFVSTFGSKLGLAKLEKVYTQINEAYYHLERNSNPRITHLNLSLDISRSLNS